MKNKGTHFLVQGAAIAAVYVVLTLVFAPLSFGEVQIRFSEALTVLPFFTPAAIPGLFVGCIIANLLGGAIPVDIIFGSIATLIGAFFTYKLRNTGRWTAPIPPIVSNIVIVPLVLRYGYGINLPIPFMMLTVGAGEFISAGVIGMILLGALSKYKNVLFHKKAAVYGFLQTAQDPLFHSGYLYLGYAKLMGDLRLGHILKISHINEFPFLCFQ